MGDYLEILKKLNLSLLFLLPLLKINVYDLEKHGFINTFLGDSEHEEVEGDLLYLLFKPKDLFSFGEFLLTQEGKGLIEDYDYDGGLVVLVYKLPEKFKGDYEHFYQSKYSRFSDEFKEQFPRTVKVNMAGMKKTVGSTQWAIFSRDEGLIKEWEDEIGVVFAKGQELWAEVDFCSEILSEEILNKYK